MFEREEYLEKIEGYLRSKQYAQLRDLLLRLEPADIAALLEESGEDTMPLLYRLLPKELAAEVFVELESDSQEMLINGFSNTELREVLDELYLDDAVDIVEEMPANVVIRILDKATPEMRKSINDMLKYPEDSAGSIMNVEYLSLKANMTVEDALKRIRRIGGELETINTLYVTDNTRHLLGVLTVRDLLLAEADDLISDLMDGNVVSVNTLDDKEAVAQAMSKYDYLSMPVVDQENRLIGIVTVDDAMDVMEEEATEDIEKMAAITPTDKPYLKTSAFDTFKARIPWLLLLMVSATFTGLIITSFETSLAVVPVLTAYIPMLMDTGGNCGSQASVTVIRALSLDEVEFSDILQVVWKEIRVAVLCGAVLAVANYAKMMLVDRMLLGNTALSPLVAGVVCLTLVCAVAVAKFVGCTLPLLAKKIGLDPAVMASPFITTIVDARSLLIYFQFATHLLGL
ncbi:MAG: magnesium transporter [Oscillospiraceae bacterium]|nr:magnesium transporter [Oscillospiraceae bacterium]